MRGREIAFFGALYIISFPWNIYGVSNPSPGVLNIINRSNCFNYAIIKNVYRKIFILFFKIFIKLSKDNFFACNIFEIVR